MVFISFSKYNLYENKLEESLGEHNPIITIFKWWAIMGAFSFLFLTFPCHAFP
jgi:hypothetical protein